MAQFKYTLPSGKQYVLTAPAGTTQVQADYVFYTQVAAGSLVGYTAGQTLASSATKLIEFYLSRLERGTAGVPGSDVTLTLSNFSQANLLPGSTVLAIVDGSPIIAPVPPLPKAELVNPINQADLAAIDPAALPPIGPLQPEQVAALIAQVINNEAANPTPNTVTPLGFSCEALERVGVFKPGACSRDTFQCCLQSPESYTGAFNINTYAQLVSDQDAQLKIQAALMQQSYDSLTAAGIIQQTPEPAASISNGVVYTSNGLQPATATGLLLGSAGLSSLLQKTVSGALSGTGLGALASTAQNTVTGALNSASQLSTAINTLSGQGVSVANNLINGSLSGVTNVAATVAGDVGALVTNASKYGTTITGLWSSGGLGSLASTGLDNLTTGALTSVSGIASGALSSVSGLANGALSSVSGLANGALSSVSGLASGALGSVSGIASGALGSLGGVANGAISSALGPLTNLVSGSLGSLTTAASSAIGNLGSALNVGGLMSQFSVDLSILSSDSLVSTKQLAVAFSNQVNRLTVNNAVTQILGNPKIPTPTFEMPPNPATLANNADIAQAKNILQSLNNTGSQLLAQGQSAIQSAGSAVSNLFG